MNKLFYSLLFYCLSVSLSNERETDNSLLFERANESSMLIIEDRLPIADPYVLFYKDKYYAYGTRTNGFEVYISDDLEHWLCHRKTLGGQSGTGPLRCII